MIVCRDRRLVSLLLPLTPTSVQIFSKIKQDKQKSFNQNSSSHSQLSESKIIPICGLGARFECSHVQANIQIAATKVTDRDYFTFRKRLSALFILIKDFQNPSSLLHLLTSVHSFLLLQKDTLHRSQIHLHLRFR